MDYEMLFDVDMGEPRPIRARTGTRRSASSRIAQGASALGISEELYMMHLEAGKNWCAGHQRRCPVEAFGKRRGLCMSAAVEGNRRRSAPKQGAPDA